MTWATAAQTGVVCDDRPAVRRTVTSLLARCGFAVDGEADRFEELCALLSRTAPTVAILTLPIAGRTGLSAITELRAVAPRCALVVLSAYGNLELAAREAGACALVPEDDLQALQIVLRGIAGAPRHVNVSLPDQRVQMAVPEVAVSAAPSVA
jgi:DNA-binding NarL/FixJ family response regulator